MSAFSSEDEDDMDAVYNKLVDSLESREENIQETVFQPEFNFYFNFLMSKLTEKKTLSTFFPSNFLLFAANCNLCCKY